MKKKTKMVRLKDAVLAAEKAYRRGFQQGALHHEKWGISQEDCAEYRYKRDIKRAWCAPEMYDDGKVYCAQPSMTLLGRFEVENPGIIVFEV